METAKSSVMRSPEIDKLAAALAKAQGAFAVPQKTRTAEVQMRAEKGGGKYTYKYADLADIMAAIVPALSANELALLQPIDADGPRLTTMLVHSSGQFYGATYDLPTGLPAQAFGSALTYARRYSLSLVGIVAEEDDDAKVGQTYSQRKQKADRSYAAHQANKSPVKPKDQQTGTSVAPLESPPADWPRERIMSQLTALYPAFLKAYPQVDLSAEIYGKYAVPKRTELMDNQAWDFLRWMTQQLRAKGVEV